MRRITLIAVIGAIALVPSAALATTYLATTNTQANLAISPLTARLACEIGLSGPWETRYRWKLRQRHRRVKGG